MAKLPDFEIDSFDGGLVTNKGDHLMDKNEFKNTLNLDFDEPGKVKRRRGFQRVGQTLSGVTIDNSFSYKPTSVGNNANRQLLISRAANAALYELYGTYTTAAVATTDTTITVGGTGLFTATGTIEINGDLIAYTGTTATTFTGCSGIRVAILAFSEVHQIGTISAATGLDTLLGTTFAVLNDVVFISSYAGNNVYFDGSAVTAITDDDQPSILFAVTYRRRIYGAGGNATNAADSRNGKPVRLMWSDVDSVTSWDINNFTDFVSYDGDLISGLAVQDDVLFVFGENSVWAYNEFSIKQTLFGVGAYNNKVIQNINGLFYTFCSAGVFETNGFSARKISDPVETYVRNFRAEYDQTLSRVVTNTFAGKFDDKYYLYIGSPTEPESLSDVTLVFDTKKRQWTVYNGFLNFTHFGSFNRFLRGSDASSSANSVTSQRMESLFAGTSSGIYYRLFDRRFLDNQAARTKRGGDILPDQIDNNAGLAISTILETPFMELGSKKWKKISAIQTVIERGDYQISYRLDQGKRRTDWISLGNFQQGTVTKKLHPRTEGGYNANEGYRISLRVTSFVADTLNILNSIRVLDIDTLDKIEYAEYE